MTNNKVVSSNSSKNDRLTEISSNAPGENRQMMKIARTSALVFSQRQVDRYILAPLEFGVFQRRLRHRQLDLRPGKHAMGYYLGSRGGGRWWRWPHCNFDFCDLWPRPSYN